MTLRREIINKFRKDCKRIKEEYNYSNLGHAFVHLSSTLIFDLDDEETIDYCSIGRWGSDYGIDAFFEKNDTLYIIQGKYSQQRTSFSRNDLQDLQSAITFLSSPPSNIKKNELLQIIQSYENYKIQRKNINLVLLLFGRLTKTGTDYINSFKSQLPENHFLEVFDLDKIIDIYIQSFGIYSGTGPDVTLKIKDSLLKSDDGALRCIICTIPASEIAKVVILHRHDIFQLNVREYLGMGSVNKEIINTIKNPEEKRFFWYYNLGITAICDKFQIKGEEINIKNFRIVNGCQTATLLAENKSELDNIEIMVRIIETSDPELVNKITIRNNTQNPIRGRDLFSQDSKQIEIQKYFAARNPPIFYERRAGEWRNLPYYKKLKFKDKSTRKYRIINNYDAAKAFMAFVLKKPAEAKMKKKLIFVSKNSGGYYEDIFNDNLNPEKLLFSFFIYSEIKKRIKEFIKNYENFSEEVQKKLALRRAFLPHSDTQLTALFGSVIDMKYPNDEYSPRDLCNSFQQNPGILNSIYEKIVSILEITIKQAKTVHGEKFNIRNYLVNSRTFEILEDNLKLQKETILPILQMFS